MNLMNLKFYMVKNENKFETLIWIIKNKNKKLKK